MVRIRQLFSKGARPRTNHRVINYDQISKLRTVKIRFYRETSLCRLRTESKLSMYEVFIFTWHDAFVHRETATLSDSSHWNGTRKATTHAAQSCCDSIRGASNTARLHNAIDKSIRDASFKMFLLLSDYPTSAKHPRRSLLRRDRRGEEGIG